VLILQHGKITVIFLYMPLIYQHQINENSHMGVWHIAEQEAFFLKRVPLQREITHWHKRLQHLAGRFLLTELVPDFPYELIRIADTRKPFLENEAWHFSLSHCGDYAAAIVSRDKRVGVDVELVSEKVARVRHKFLTEEERGIVGRWALSDERAGNFQLSTLNFQLLTACWSIKEALFKWKGSGEIDFRQHLRIERIELKDNEGKAWCRFLKDADIELVVDFLFFNENCLSWVMS
jgi:phosphopantetheinyl transferase